MSARYDVCKLMERGDALPTDVFPRAHKEGAEYVFWNPPERFTLGKKIAAGASGTIYRGTFAARAIAIKINDSRRVPLQTDADEVWMQTKLFCHMRDLAKPPPHARIAHVPTTYFSARVPGMGRALGMGRVDRSLLAHVTALATPRAQIAALRDALARIAALLEVLQVDLAFMHGDLHAENVMVRDAPHDVFLIDFGMSSLASPSIPGARTRSVGGRIITDDRYEGARFHAQLDLLTLLTALREDLALAKCEVAARWCGAFVQPYWDVVRAGLLSGKVRPKLRYGAQRTVRTAREEIEESGEIYYAHHLLYERLGDIVYPPTAPRALLRALAAAPRTAPRHADWQARIFEDV